MSERAIRVTASAALDDPLGYIREHPDAAGAGFEVIAADLPLPGGGELPLLGLSDGGVTTLVDRSTGERRRDLERIAGGISFLRRRGEWIGRFFPDRVFRRIEIPRLILVTPHRDDELVEQLQGLALSRLTLLRARRARGADGRHAMIVEKEQEWNFDTERTVSPDDMTAEESAFFQGLEGEMRTVRNQGGVR